MRVAEELLGSYQHRIEGLTLIPGPKGTFDVTVDGALIFSKHDEGRHAQPGEVLKVFKAILGPGVRVYEP